MSPTSLVWDIPQTGPPVSTGPKSVRPRWTVSWSMTSQHLWSWIFRDQKVGGFSNETKRKDLVARFGRVGVVWVWLVGGGLVSLLVHGYCNRNSYNNLHLWINGILSGGYNPLILTSLRAIQVGGVNSNIFLMFTSKLGEMMSIFQMGWFNHQLGRGCVGVSRVVYHLFVLTIGFPLIRLNMNGG